MTSQVETSPGNGLEWLRATLDELRKDNVRLGMRVAALETDAKFRKKEADELRRDLADARSQLTGTSTELRNGIRADVLSDLETLTTTDRALATALVLVTAKIMQSGASSLERLGCPADVVKSIRDLVFGAQSAAAPSPLLDAGDGFRHSPPPSADHELALAPRDRNAMKFMRIPAEEYANIERRAELESSERSLPDLTPRRATDASMPSGR